MGNSVLRSSALPGRPAGWLLALVVGLLPRFGQGQSSLSAPTIPQLLAEAQKLQRQFRESEALAKYEEVLSKAPASYEALWSAAVLSVRIGTRYTDETRKEAYFAAARLYANRALVVEPEGGEAHYAAAFTIVNQATLQSARGRLLAYREMKPYVFMAVARRPDWAEAWQLLGRWHYRVDHYNLVERAFSRFFLGGTPSGAGSRKAIDALKRAHELAPQRIQFCYDLGRVYRNQGQRSKAIEMLEKVQKITPATSEELELSRRSRNLLVVLHRKARRHAKRLAVRERLLHGRPTEEGAQ